MTDDNTFDTITNELRNRYPTPDHNQTVLVNYNSQQYLFIWSGKFWGWREMRITQGTKSLPGTVVLDLDGEDKQSAADRYKRAMKIL